VLEKLVKDNVSASSIHDSFHTLASMSLENPDKNSIRKLLVYTHYCRNNKSTSSRQFNELLLFLASNVDRSRFIKSSLAIMIEQSAELVNRDQLLVILERLTEKIPNLFFRQTDGEWIFQAIISEDIKLEIIVFQDDLLNAKLAINCLLFYKAAPEIFEVRKQPQESYCKVMIGNQVDIETGLKQPLDKHYTDDIQVIFLGQNGYESPEAILVSKQYEGKANLEEHPNSKCNMFLIVSGVRMIINHIYHTDIEKQKQFRKSITRKIAYFFDYTNIEEMNEAQSFTINLNQI
jgi:hypothetical protein